MAETARRACQAVEEELGCGGGGENVSKEWAMRPSLTSLTMTKTPPATAGQTDNIY
jgi:hypothetical protein